ncbi:MAG: hypothetical protein QF569_29480, partial [Candidatus Poribacteria bacterium]|nr:hypothetical protein [Candidatus Poribacteria bacterium]
RIRSQQIKGRSESDFKRLTAVSVSVFRQMLPTLFSPTNRGRPAKLSCSRQRLMRLMSWRDIELSSTRPQPMRSASLPLAVLYYTTS